MPPRIENRLIERLYDEVEQRSNKPRAITDIPAKRHSDAAIELHKSTARVFGFSRNAHDGRLKCA